MKENVTLLTFIALYLFQRKIIISSATKQLLKMISYDFGVFKWHTGGGYTMYHY